VTSGRSKERFLDAWLLESECIYHMSPKKEWFSTTSLLKEDNPDENDAACKTIRISSIRMKMFDGQVRTLKNMRHVPDPGTKHLSLGP